MRSGENNFSPKERAAQKQAARVKDMDAVKSGSMSAKLINQKNGAIAHLMSSSRVSYKHGRKLG
jgi:hypothetical protein